MAVESSNIADLNKSWEIARERVGDKFPAPYVWDGNNIEKAFANLVLEIFPKDSNSLIFRRLSPEASKYQSLKLIRGEDSLFLGGITIPSENYDHEELDCISQKHSLSEVHPFYSAYLLLKNPNFYMVHRIFSDAIAYGIMNKPRNNDELSIAKLMKEYNPIKEPMKLIESFLRKKRPNASSKNIDTFLEEVNKSTEYVRKKMNVKRKNFDGSWDEVKFI